MTRERRQDIVLFAFALSVAVHVGLMFFMRPQVMTHVAGAGARDRARVAMRVKDRAERPEAVAMEEVADIAPVKESPEAENDPLMPSPDGFATPDAAPLLPALPAALPEVSSVPVMAVENAPLLSEPIHIGAGISSFTTPLADDAPLMFTPRTAGTAPAAAAPAPLPPPPALPEPEPPSISPVFDSVAEVLPADDSGLAKKEIDPFIPRDEVMRELDEKIVESEKAAVRGLLDDRNAQELSGFADVAATRADAGAWTYFHLQFAPRGELETVPKDLVILIDASGSIANDRLSSCRTAAREVLRTCMNSGDRFNLVAFRDRFDYAFPVWRECDKPSYEAADRWMNRLAAHGRTDVFATISSVLKLPRDPKRPLIALVITDGDANAGVSATSQILSRFTALNDGLVSVYMYGVKAGANKTLIDALTHGNRGESFIHTGDRKSAGEGIAALTRRFRDPLLTDLRLVFPSGSRAEAYPERLKNLYRGETVDVIGRVPSGMQEVSFSLKGLNGEKAYEGFFKVDLRGAANDANLPAAWNAEKSLDARLHRGVK